MEFVILNGGVDVIHDPHADRASTVGPKRTGRGM
jgi:hypothetical protein